MTLNIGGRVHDPTDPVRRLLFNVLAMIAEFESGLIRMRTREGMKVARAKRPLRGQRPKRKPRKKRYSSSSRPSRPTLAIGTRPENSRPDHLRDRNLTDRLDTRVTVAAGRTPSPLARHHREDM